MVKRVPAVSKLRSKEELFAGCHFDREVIILGVRWYLRYKALVQIARGGHVGGGQRVFCRLGSKHGIPDCRRSFAFAAQLPEGELSLVDTA